MDNTTSNAPVLLKIKRQVGMHCIAPGCQNYFYNNKERVHYHRLPLRNASLLSKWLQKLKRADPPVNSYSRVCSDHFLDTDYVFTGCFLETGEYKSIKSSKLVDNAAPTVFDFSNYSTGNTDRPSKEVCELTRLREERYRQHARQKEMGMTPAEKKKFYEELNRQKKKAANAKHRAKKKAEDPPKPPKALSQTKGAIAVRKCREKKKEALIEQFVGGNGPTKEYPDPTPAEGITDRRRISRKKRPRERANHRTFPPSKKLRPLRENTYLNTDPSEDVSKTEVTASTFGLDSQTEGEYIMVSINQSQMASPSYRAIRLDGTYDFLSDPYSQSETFPPALQCLSPVPSSGEVKAEFGFESTNYSVEEPKERFMKSEGMEGGIEWNCAGGIMKEERRRLFNIKEEQENPECGMTTEEKYRMHNLKMEEEEDKEVEEREERRIVKIEREEDVRENIGFRIKEEEVIDEYEETGGTDLNFPTYRCEGNLNIVSRNESCHCPLW
ncbi:hypothetical protein GJAV_G00122250 [Gymnothorax javanicus]|nr:hypothetical protein GJAV_G00122250 [Gymnothorax javanicus]